MNDANKLMSYTTLVDILESNRSVDRAVTYVDGENSERRVPYGDVYTRALGILYHLQAMGAQRGDKMIIFLSSNEQFLDGYWAAVCGGIVPVPLAVGISDEHRHKLLRVARKLGKPLLYTDAKNLERLQALAARSAKPPFSTISSRAASWWNRITDISRPGKLHRPAPDDLAFIQFSSGSTSEPKGVMLTHGNLIANTQGATAVGKYNDQDVTLSWMPLTHDMGLIGFYLMQFANRVHINLMPTELFVRRPLLWLQVAAKKARHPHLLAEFRLPALSEGIGRPAPRGHRPVVAFGRSTTAPNRSRWTLCNEFMSALAYTGLKHTAMFPGVWPRRGVAGRGVSGTRGGLSLDAREPAQARGGRARIELNPRCARCAGTRVPRARGSQHGNAHRRRFARRAAEGQVGHILDSRRQRDARLLRRSGGHRARHRCRRLGGHRRSRLHARGLAVHRRPRQGNHLRQRPELLPLRSGKHRAARAGIGPQQAGGRGSRQTGRPGRGIGGVRAPSRQHGRSFCPPRRPSAASSTNTPVSKWHRSSPPSASPRPPAARCSGICWRRPISTASSMRNSRSCRRCARRRRRAHSVRHRTRKPPAIDLRSGAAGQENRVNDNLFEIGASSLKLIEIHENVDREFPGLIDLTELFDHPTIAELAKHLEGKLTATTPR
jgi:aryl carrier-like protein